MVLFPENIVFHVRERVGLTNLSLEPLSCLFSILLACSVLKISSPNEGVLPLCNFFFPLPYLLYFIHGLGLLSLGLSKCSFTIQSCIDFTADTVSTLDSDSYQFIAYSFIYVDPALENLKWLPFLLSSKDDSASFQLESGSKLGVCWCCSSVGLKSGLSSQLNGRSNILNQVASELPNF